MSVHLNKPENLTQQNPESFSEKVNSSAPASFNMFMSADVFSRGKLNGGEFEAYLILNSFASGSGVFFVSDKALKERYPHLIMRTFRRSCASLEKKGLIYKDHIHIKGERWGGSVRKGTTADVYFKYVEKLLREGKEEKAKEIQDYFQSFHRKRAPVKNGRYPPVKNGRSIEVYKYTSNIVEKKGVGPPSLFLDKMIDELRQRKFTSEQLKIAKAYIQAEEPKLKEKKNPLPYIVKMLGKGWAQDALAQKQAAKALEDLREKKEKAQQDRFDRNRKQAQEIKKWIYDHPDEEFSLSSSDYHVEIRVRGKSWMRVEFKDKDAIERMDNIIKYLKVGGK